MLVSVTERTREIGIRKAIGAKEASILWQFVLESIIISAVGGAIGAAGGVAGAVLVGTYTPYPTEVQLWSILISLTVSAVVGVLFGSYPAWRAARLDPVEALRYE